MARFVNSRIITSALLFAFCPTVVLHAAETTGNDNFIRRCVASLDRPPPIADYRVRYLGENSAMAARLLALVQSGEKSVTFSTPRLYQGNRHLTPVKGSYTILTDFEGNPGALLKTRWVRTKPFNKVSERESRYEGKPVRPLAAWRKVHWDFFTRSLAPLGESPSRTMPVTIEKFDLVCVAGAGS